jgi:NAD+ synthase (glutamine-hydrolysing)
MKKFDYLTINTFSPEVAIGDVETNAKRIVECISSVDGDIYLFPELSLTGYTCGDLFGQQKIHDDVIKGLRYIVKNFNLYWHKFIVVGAPIQCGNSLYNCAVVIHKGKILGIIPKQFLPNYKEFYEARWFRAADGNEPNFVDNFDHRVADNFIPFGIDLLFKFENVKIGIEICEDLWMPIPPSSYQAIAGANVLLNLSASNETVAKSNYRRTLVSNQSGRCIAAYAYCSAGPTESTTDLVFGGHNIIAENGTVLAESEKFLRKCNVLSADIDIQKLNTERQRTNSFGASIKLLPRKYKEIDIVFKRTDSSNLNRKIEKFPFVPSGIELEERCKEIFSIQTCALAKRLEQLSPRSTINIGVSGGLDSTLALLVAIKTCDILKYDRKRIQGITMPGFGTTSKTKNNAETLMNLLGISQKSIDISELCLQSFREMNYQPFGIPVKNMVDNTYYNLEQFKKMLRNVTPGQQDLIFENVQARIRTLMLMSHGFVLGTGDLSESALGWCTYNGDHMSMYNVNCSIPKTLVKFLVQYIATKECNPESNVSKVLLDIVNTTISPELLPSNGNDINQKTEDLVGPYELHDFFLANFIRSGAEPEKIIFLAKSAFENYTEEEIRNWCKVFFDRFFKNQFKRSCVPDGPKVGSVSLSPRGDWRMPSDSAANISWMK